jgi:hypothetical protein
VGRQVSGALGTEIDDHRFPSTDSLGVFALEECPETGFGASAVCHDDARSFPLGLGPLDLEVHGRRPTVLGGCGAGSDCQDRRRYDKEARGKH